MRHRVFILLCAIFVFINFSPFHPIAAQTNYDMPMTFSVTSTAINRFIASQWSNLPNNATWSDEYQGLIYSFQLTKPTISLSTNVIKINLSLSITSSVYNGSVTLTPMLTIPSTTISASNIIAEYTDLHQQILNAAQLVDFRLQHVIEQALAQINWIMYQGKVLSESTARWTESADIGWRGIPTLTFAAANNELNLTVTPTIYSNVPLYTFQYTRPENVNFGIKVNCNSMCEIKAIRFWNILGEQIAKSEQNVSAVYDPGTGRYTATLVVTAPNPVAWNFNKLFYEVKVRRRNTETLWHMEAGPILGTFSTWVYFASNEVSAIRGE